MPRATGTGSPILDVALDPLSTPLCPQVKPGKQRKVMGVLDIYGFEIFQVSAGSSRPHSAAPWVWA